MLPPDGITRPGQSCVTDIRPATAPVSLPISIPCAAGRTRIGADALADLGNGSRGHASRGSRAPTGSKGWGVFRVVPILAGCLGGWFAVEGAWPLHLRGLALGGLLALGVSFVLGRSGAPTSGSGFDADEGGARHRLGLPQAHRIALVLIPITIIALTVVQRFDAMLVSFHQPGEIAAGVPAVTGLFLTPASRSTSLLDAVRSWAFYAQTQPRSNGSDRADARWFVQGYVGFDSLLLVPVYALLAAFSIAWSRQMLEQQWITISRTADIHAPGRAGRR